MSPIDLYIHQPEAAIADYKDLITWVITLLGVAMTVMAVYTSYFLGRKYADHVEEIRHISQSHARIEKYYLETRLVHHRQTAQLELGFQTIVRLYEISRQISDHEASRRSLAERGMLWERPVPTNERKNLDGAIGVQIDKLHKKLEARRFELLCLSTDYPVCLNHIRYLSHIYGDEETVTFLERYVRTSGNKKVKADCERHIGALEARLAGGMPAHAVYASRWTGE